MSTPQPFISYDQAMSWLWSLVKDPEGKRFLVKKTMETRRQEMTEALARTADFLAMIGNPERAIPTVHVTGTSGKGSVTMMLAHLLGQLGHSVSHHTSPYLQTPREKMIINGQLVNPAEVTRLMSDLRLHMEKWKAQHPDRFIKYGEAWVILTFLWLADSGSDWAVNESGMGGRFDPTNAGPSELAVITNVAKDHVQSLGPELTDIAWHKAGIIKQGKPAVTGVTDPKLLSVLEAEAQEKDSPLFVLDRDFSFERLPSGNISVHGVHQSYLDIPIGPIGRFQQLNATLAIAALDVLMSGQLPTQLSLADCVTPGRMEHVSREPLVILDGAHNPHKMAALVDSLESIYPNYRKIALVGGIANKDVMATLNPLAKICDEVIATRPTVPGKPAVDPQQIADTLAAAQPNARVTAHPDPIDALKDIMSTMSANELLIVSGSLYLIGQVREYWYPTKNIQ